MKHIQHSTCNLRQRGGYKLAKADTPLLLLLLLLHVLLVVLRPRDDCGCADVGDVLCGAKP
jgi:hypothetical protein